MQAAPAFVDTWSSGGGCASSRLAGVSQCQGRSELQKIICDRSCCAESCMVDSQLVSRDTCISKAPAPYADDFQKHWELSRLCASSWCMQPPAQHCRTTASFRAFVGRLGISWSTSVRVPRLPRQKVNGEPYRNHAFRVPRLPRQKVNGDEAPAVDPIETMFSGLPWQGVNGDYR